MAQHITASDPSMPAVCHIHTGATPSSVVVLQGFDGCVEMSIVESSFFHKIFLGRLYCFSQRLVTPPKALSRNTF